MNRSKAQPPQKAPWTKIRLGRSWGVGLKTGPQARWRAKGRKRLDDLEVAVALERHHQGRGLVELGPSPGVELDWRVQFKVHFGVLSLEAECEPGLGLAAPALRLGELRGEVVSQDFGRASQKAYRGDAGLFHQLAPRRRLELLALVDPALREPASCAAGRRR